MNARAFLATTGRGIARATRDENGTWSVEHLLADQDIRCLAADPLNPAEVYAGTQGQGVLRSGDGGRTWRPAGLKGQIVKSVAVSRVEPGVVYAGTKPPLLFVSRDGGATWTELDAFRHIPSRRLWFSPAERPGTAYAQAIALSPIDPNLILVGIEFGAVVRSTDGGRSWADHRKRAVRDCHSLIFHHSEGEWAYEGGGGGAALSRDAGATWTQPKKDLDRRYGWAVAADPVRPEIWYFSASPGPFKAHGGENAEACIYRAEGGGPWERLDGGLPQPLRHMPYALLTGPTAPGHVYAGLSNGDVWHSMDHGDSWLKLPFNLGKINRSLVML